MIFSASVRNSNNSSLADYELMTGGRNKQFSFELEKERQNGIMYDYQEFKYNKEFEETVLDISMINNQEDGFNLLSVSNGVKITDYTDAGISLIRKNWEKTQPAFYMKTNWKDRVISKYTLAKSYFINELTLKYPIKLTERLKLVSKASVVDTNSTDYFKAKIQLEWRIK